MRKHVDMVPEETISVNVVLAQPSVTRVISEDGVQLYL